MAEREGFEPPIPLRVCLISSQVHSTGLCHLSVVWRLGLPLTLCLIKSRFVPDRAPSPFHYASLTAMLMVKSSLYNTALKSIDVACAAEINFAALSRGVEPHEASKDLSRDNTSKSIHGRHSRQFSPFPRAMSGILQICRPSARPTAMHPVLAWALFRHRISEKHDPHDTYGNRW